MFQACPFDIDWDSFGVELGSSHTKITPKDGVVYQALPSSMNIWYDSPTAMSYLILPLFPSPKMAARHDEIGDAWGRSFLPFMVIAPSPRLRHRGFMNSISTGLVDCSPRLTFHLETVIESNDTYPAHNGFYQDYLARGAVSNEVFLEEFE